MSRNERVQFGIIDEEKLSLCCTHIDFHVDFDSLWRSLCCCTKQPAKKKNFAHRQSGGSSTWTIFAVAGVELHNKVNCFMHFSVLTWRLSLSFEIADRYHSQDSTGSRPTHTISSRRLSRRLRIIGVRQSNVIKLSSNVREILMNHTYDDVVLCCTACNCECASREPHRHSSDKLHRSCWTTRNLALKYLSLASRRGRHIVVVAVMSSLCVCILDTPQWVLRAYTRRRLSDWWMKIYKQTFDNTSRTFPLFSLSMHL